MFGKLTVWFEELTVWFEKLTVWFEKPTVGKKRNLVKYGDSESQLPIKVEVVKTLTFVLIHVE